MSVYLFVISLTSVLSFASVFSANLSQRKDLVFFVFFVLFLLVGFRGNGYDYISYQNIYDGTVDGSLESGYLLLNSLAPSYRVLLIVVSFITLFFYWSVINRYSSFPFISILVLLSTLFFQSIMGQMRQGVAVSIILYSFFYLDKKKVFCLLVIAASLFHLSAIIALSFLFIPQKIYSYWIYLLLLFASLLFQSLVDISALGGDNFIVSKLMFYQEHEDFSLGLNTAIVIRFFIFSACYYVKDKVPYVFFSKMLNVFFMSILFYLAFGFIPQLAGRGSFYFACFDVLLITYFLGALKTKYRYVMGMLFILLSLSRLILFWTDDFNYNSFVPYWPN